MRGSMSLQPNTKRLIANQSAVVEGWVMREHVDEIRQRELGQLRVDGRRVLFAFAAVSAFHGISERETKARCG